MRNIPGQVKKGQENSNFQTFAGLSQKHWKSNQHAATSPWNIVTGGKSRLYDSKLSFELCDGLLHTLLQDKFDFYCTS